jgi:membrane protease YdiL (CAAX protease family)
MPLDGTALVAGVTALAGIPVYAVIAAAFGALATNPLASVVQRRFRPELMLFFMLLASLYANAIWAPSLYARLGQLVISVMLAVALWQKVHDRIPYLLDPVDSPPRRVGLAEGLIAMLFFLVLQAVMGTVLAHSPLLPGARPLVAFAVAGGVVAGCSLLFLGKVPGLLAATGLIPDGTAPRRTLRRALLPGVLGGAVAGLFALAYLAALNHVEVLRAWKERVFPPTALDTPSLVALALLMVVAAPLFEEFIFRGLVFRGLRRSFRPGVAILASAALFALAHPAISFLPVLVLGGAAALSFERSRLLLTPIVAHAVYNAIVLSSRWFL